MIEQWVHFVAAGVWIGGLVTLLIGLAALDAAGRGRVARRFSTVALGAVVVLAASGVLRAIDEVGSWHALTSTTFGQAILVKSGLLLVLIGLGALNRYRSVPAVERDARPLLTVGRVELGLAVVVLVATAVLQGQAPPASVAAASSPPPVVVTGPRLRRDGRGAAHRLARARSGSTSSRPASPTTTPAARCTADVTLSFSLRDRPDLGTSSLAPAARC